MPTNVMKNTPIPKNLKMVLELDLQIATQHPVPDKRLFKSWINNVLEDRIQNAELTIRIVDEEEGKNLNETWRKSKGATNVLSFPAGEASEFNPDFLGDIVICAPVLEKEATEQGKSIEAHWAHMVIHGTLHLLGYDHTEEEEAKLMESIEIKLLCSLGYANPYEIASA